MGCFWGRWVTIAGRPVCVENKGIRAIVGTAVLLVVTGVAGGTAGSAASASGAVDEFGGTRVSRSESEARTSGIKARIRGANDSIRATFRLRRSGGHPTTLDEQSDKNHCADYSDGDVQLFFRKHQCTSLHRTLIEYREGNYVIRFLIATIEMPDYNTASDLYALLSRDGRGNIIPLSPKGGKYRHVPFTSGWSTTTVHDTTVINVRTQVVGHTPGAEVLASLATGVLLSLD